MPRAPGPVLRPRLACRAGVLALLLTTGCALEVATPKEASGLRVHGLVNGFVSADALDPYDGTLLRFGVLGHAVRRGELVSLDLWPLAGVGIGLAGLRARVLFVEAGAGVLFYDPEPLPRYRPPPVDAAGADETSGDETAEETSGDETSGDETAGEAAGEAGDAGEEESGAGPR